MRHLGLSEAGVETIRRARAIQPVVDLQIEYSLMSRGIETEILPACRALGIGITPCGCSTAKGAPAHDGHMATTNPTRERILVAAAELLRRHAPAKTTVADVARALGMSHANIYRHFASKAALRDAVAERWIHSISSPLAPIAGGPGPAADRLRAGSWRWPRRSNARFRDDPELLATYHAVAEQARDVVVDHLATLRAQFPTFCAMRWRVRGRRSRSHCGSDIRCHASLPSSAPCP